MAIKQKSGFGHPNHKIGQKEAECDKIGPEEAG
jgi:hypothetical protein